MRAIASRPRGILRDDLITLTGRSSGGGLARRLGELEEAGFIATFTPYGRKSRQAAYRLVDEYSRFYLAWIETAPRGLLAPTSEQHWLAQSQSPAYRSWSGGGFEALCLKHADAIQRAIGAQHVPTTVATWHTVGPVGQRERIGAQINLLFDRADGVITVCERKYASEEFVVSKSYARELHAKLDLFRARTGTKKQLSLALVTTHGLRRNLWSEDLVDDVVTADALFAPRARGGRLPAGQRAPRTTMGPDPGRSTDRRHPRPVADASFSEAHFVHQAVVDPVMQAPHPRPVSHLERLR